MNERVEQGQAAGQKLADAARYAQRAMAGLLEAVDECRRMDVQRRRGAAERAKRTP